MSVAQRINDFVTSNKSESICNRCIADSIGLRDKGAHPSQITLALSTTSDFEITKDRCSICKSIKHVIRRV